MVAKQPYNDYRDTLRPTGVLAMTVEAIYSTYTSYKSFKSFKDAWDWVSENKPIKWRIL